MEFEWDLNKNVQNYIKHGITFKIAIEIFLNEHFTYVDKCRDYSETREISIGKIEDLIIIVAHTFRNNRIRIISARKAKLKERIKYYEIFKNKNT